MATVMESGSARTLSETERADKVMELFSQSKAKLGRRHDLWRRAYRIVHNRTWAANRDVDTPSVSASEIFPIIASLVGWMTDQRIVFDATASADPHSQYAEFMQGLARDLSLVLESLWVNNLIDAEVEKGLFDAMIYGTAFWKITWDPAADNGAGNACMKRKDPFFIFPDPAATSLTSDDCNYVVEARRMSLEEVERRWPNKINQIMERLDSGEGLPKRDDPFTEGSGKIPMANPGGIQSDAGKGKPLYGLPSQSKRAQIGDITDGSITVYECWIKDNVLYPGKTEDEDEYYVPEWSVIVVAAGIVLMDEKAKDLYAHGSHPYVRYVAHDLGDFWGISLVDHLAPAQLAINRLLVALQNHAELCGNPIMLEDTRSGIPRSKIVNKPGQRLQKTTGSEVGWLTPPDMPQGVPNLVTFWINEMERISGLSAIVRGNTPTGRNAQGVMDSVQESAFVRVRLSLRNLERALAEAGRLMAHLVIENYTLPRTVSIVGPQGDKTMLALKARHFYAPNMQGADPMKFALNVYGGSGLPLSRSARAQEADTLFAMGAIDHQAVLEAHDYPNRRDILERVNAQMGMGIEVGGQGRNRQR